MLGITVALLADEWRETRQNRALELELLQRLEKDLSADLREVEEVEASANDVVRATSALLAAIDDPLRNLYLRRERRLPVDPDSTTAEPGSAIFSAVNGLREFDQRRSTYDEMLATGSIRVLRDAALREALADYYAFAASRERMVRGVAGAGAIQEAIDRLGISDGELRYVEDPLVWLRKIRDLGFLLRDQRASANARFIFINSIGIAVRHAPPNKETDGYAPLVRKLAAQQNSESLDGIGALRARGSFRPCKG